jgi:porin
VISEPLTGAASFPVWLACLLMGLTFSAVQADEGENGAKATATTAIEFEEADSEQEGTQDSEKIGGNDQDPSVMLQDIERKRAERDSLFKDSPLERTHRAADRWDNKLYDKTHLRAGLSVHHLFQLLSESFPGTDDWGTATDADLVFQWEVGNRGKPYQGNLYFHLESRWNWGTTGPMSLGAGSLGMLQNTGNTYEKYVPVTIIRNFYYQMGSAKSKGAVRFGKVTIDSILGVSSHNTPNTSFLSFAATGAFAIALPDSGVGTVAAWHFNDRLKLLGSIHDSNANRLDLGDISHGGFEGDFFSALELGYKFAPEAKRIGYSKLDVWHTDGTADGKPINGSNGPDGWGFYALHEQQLSRNGDAVAVFKYGKSYNKSAYFESQVSASFLYYEPHFFGTIRNDLLATSLNWVDPVAAGARNESNVEILYRYPVNPRLDMTFTYMGIINPALDPTNSYASAFSLRFVTAF